jgi:hypothetical protein
MLVGTKIATVPAAGSVLIQRLKREDIVDTTSRRKKRRKELVLIAVGLGWIWSIEPTMQHLLVMVGLFGLAVALSCLCRRFEPDDSPFAELPRHDEGSPSSCDEGVAEIAWPARRPVDHRRVAVRLDEVTPKPM